MNDGTQQLPETARNALIRIADALREGFTGRFEIECSSGGVRHVLRTDKIDSDQLRDDA